MLSKLKTGDSIGVFSASAPVTYLNYKKFLKAKEFLSSKGFNIVEGALTNKYDYYRSGTIKERADELNELIRNKNIRCIMATGGGWVSNSILPYIDYKAFLDDPKIIIGFSDITAIVLGIFSITGVHTYYGADFISFGIDEPYNHYNYKYFSDLFINTHDIPYRYEMPPIWRGDILNSDNKTKEEIEKSNEWVTVSNGKVKGRLIGGNFNTITGIWGSIYMPKILEGDILLLEDVAKNASITERSFSLLKLNGVFDKVKGIILGKHNAYDDEGSKRKPYEILLEVLGDTNIPILSEFDCSHTSPLLTLPIGVDIELDATNKNVSILNDWIK